MSKRLKSIWVLLTIACLVVGLGVGAADMSRQDAPVEKTGQTDCYKSASPWETCTCGTADCPSGQDGDLEKGVAWPSPRFTDNGDGTVTDKLTGLVWMDDASCDSFGTLGKNTWSGALSECNTLASGSCGLTDGSIAGDWRLPNSKELQSLAYLEVYDPALSNTAGTGRWSEGDPFTGVQSASYWSSTTRFRSSDRDSAWRVSLDDGVFSYNPKTFNRYVWCVRDVGSPTNGMNGTYTINDGGGGDYASFAAAVSDLESRGVDGSVTFLVYDDGGDYNEQVEIDQSITGAAATNYIRFQEAPGEDVTIDGQSTRSYGIYLHSGATYIEFWGFTITNTTSFGVYINGNSSDNNMIKQCTLGNIGGVSAIRVYAGDDNAIQGNAIENPGASNTSGIYLSTDADNNYINNNYIYGGDFIDYGIELYTNCDRNEISNNTIHAVNYGIYLSNFSETHDNNIIFNNMIYDCAIGINDYGWSSSSRSISTFIYFNSILANKGFSCYRCESPNIRNNIFSCTGTQASSAFAISLSNCTSVTSDYNDLWAPYGYIGYWNGTPYSTLATWRTASGGDANSISMSPHFASTTDLHINSSSHCIDAGVVISGGQYEYDFDGEVRDGYSKRGTAPDIGADEYYDPPDPLFVDFIRFDAQALGRDVQITWTTAEEIEAAGFYIWRSDEGGEFELITDDPIPAQGGPLFGADYTYLDQGLMVGQTYEYRLEAVNIYGQSQYEGPVAVTVGALCGTAMPSPARYVPFALVLLFVPALIGISVKRRCSSFN